MFAVIRTGGKQYKVEEGDKLKIEKLDRKEGASVSFNDVLLVSEKEGANMKLGKSKVSGAKVEAKVLEQGRARKIDVIKYKNKTRYKRKIGHRQLFTQVEITKITA